MKPIYDEHKYTNLRNQMEFNKSNNDKITKCFNEEELNTLFSLFKLDQRRHLQNFERMDTMLA